MVSQDELVIAIVFLVTSSAGSGRFALPDPASRYAPRYAPITPGHYPLRS
jgi:hypothetical protein